MDIGIHSGGHSVERNILTPSCCVSTMERKFAVGDCGRPSFLHIGIQAEISVILAVINSKKQYLNCSFTPKCSLAIITEYALEVLL